MKPCLSLVVIDLIECCHAARSKPTERGNCVLPVLLVSYIRNSLRFLYSASLSTCFQNLEKNWGHLENLGESGVKLFRDLTEKTVNFSTLPTSNMRLLLIFWWRGSINQISPIGKKTIHDHRRKSREKLQLFDETISLPEPKFYSKIYGDCNSS